MRNFVISTLCLLIMVGIWTGFHIYSDRQTDHFSSRLEQLVSEHIMEEQWTDAEDAFNDLTNDWDKYKHTAAFFLEAKPINDIDCTMERARFYILAEDFSNSAGELSYLRDLFIFLHENESLSSQNIF